MFSTDIFTSRHFPLLFFTSERISLENSELWLAHVINKPELVCTCITQKLRATYITSSFKKEVQWEMKTFVKC